MPTRDFSSVDEMNKTLLDNINSAVQPGDVLYHLGDFSMGPNWTISKMRELIKCKTVHLIFGNHDKVIEKSRHVQRLFTSTRQYHRIYHKEVKLYLFHCPMHTWPGINRGTIQLHGHCHSNLKDRGLRQKDIGVDTNQFKPYLLDDVVDLMLARSIDRLPDIDHHTVKKEESQEWESSYFPEGVNESKEKWFLDFKTRMQSYVKCDHCKRQVTVRQCDDCMQIFCKPCWNKFHTVESGNPCPLD